VPSTPWSQNPLLALHPASTGLDPETAELVAVGIAAHGIDRPWSRTLLVSPRTDIPPEASNVHGISTARARRDGIPVAEALAELATLLEVNRKHELPVVVYTARWGLTLLERESHRAGFDLGLRGLLIVDPLVLDLHSHPARRTGQRRLPVLAHTYGVEPARTDTPERAARVVVDLARSYATRFRAVAALSSAELHAAQSTWWVEHANDANRHREDLGRIERISADWPMLSRPTAQPTTAIHPRN